MNIQAPISVIRPLASAASIMRAVFRKFPDGVRNRISASKGRNGLVLRQHDRLIMERELSLIAGAGQQRCKTQPFERCFLHKRVEHSVIGQPLLPHIVQSDGREPDKLLCILAISESSEAKPSRIRNEIWLSSSVIGS